MIRDPVDESKIEAIDIISAEYAGGYKIHLWFSDGKDHVVDFEPFLTKACNPMATQFRDPKKFMLFTVEYGNLVWGNGQMAFSTKDLYNNDVGGELDILDRQKLEAITRQFVKP